MPRMDLEGWSIRLKVLADATRVRLLALLEREELTVAELSAITRLAQPRVSTHLAKLKEAGLVRDRRAGVSAYYRFEEDSLDSRSGPCGKPCAAGATIPCSARGRRTRPRRARHARGRPELGRFGGRRHGTPLFAGPHLGSARAHGAPAAESRRTCSTSPPATACSPNCSRRTRAATCASMRARAW
jgi:DNA-binding transcriptional ArsR family regulator